MISDRSKQLLTEQARPKVNLTLHVTGLRPDGYHLLDSLVVFADAPGDRLTFSLARQLTLTVDGPRASGVPTDHSNLVLKAARFLSADRGAAITLTKCLPSAAGIGGGSSDAAATLRALSVLWGCDVPDNTSVLGADVPVCWSTGPKRMQGVGEQVAGVTGLPDCWLVLVNPGVSASTPDVFKTLVSKGNTPMPTILPSFPDVHTFADWLSAQRNDLQDPARRLVPQIDAVLDCLSGSLLARMSGSGATCFGLYPDAVQAKAAEASIHAAHAEWWVTSGRILQA